VGSKSTKTVQIEYEQDGLAGLLGYTRPGATYRQREEQEDCETGGGVVSSQDHPLVCIVECIGIIQCMQNIVPDC